MNKPLIQIWDTVGLGLIIEYSTGILISNQTGGTACLHPEIEGIYLPLCNDYLEEGKKNLSPEIELTHYFKEPKYRGSGAINGIDIEDVKKINAIISKFNLDKFIEIDLNKLAESHEAWIRIKIYNDKNNELIKGFSNYPLNGILTWANSD